MPNTTNFNWPTPADTDLVKDGAAAIRNLGNGIDTSLIDLKGGTTGQILSKASNADMDFTFITPNVGDITEVQAGTGISVASGTGPIPVVTNSMATEITAKGDLIVGTGSGTFDNLPAGTNGYTLVADSVETTGLKWVAASSGALNYVGGTTFTTSSAVNVNDVFSSTYDYYLILLNNTASTDGLGRFRLRVSGADNTTSNYSGRSIKLYTTVESTTVYSDYWNLNVFFAAGSYTAIYVYNPNVAARTGIMYDGVDIYNETNDVTRTVGGGVFKADTTFTGFTVYPASGTITGKLKVYGLANS